MPIGGGVVAGIFEEFEKYQLKNGIRVFIGEKGGSDMPCDYCPKKHSKYFTDEDGYIFYYCSKTCMRTHEKDMGGILVRFYKIVDKEKDRDMVNSIPDWKVKQIVEKELENRKPKNKRVAKCQYCGSGSFSILRGDVHCMKCFKLLNYHCECVCHKNHKHHCEYCKRS